MWGSHGAAQLHNIGIYGADVGFAWGSSAPHHCDLWGRCGVCMGQLSPTSLGPMGQIWGLHGAAQPHITAIYGAGVGSIGQMWGLHGAAQPYITAIYGADMGSMGQMWGLHEATWPHIVGIHGADVGFAWGSSAPHHWDPWGRYRIYGVDVGLHGAAQPHIMGIYGADVGFA